VLSFQNYKMRLFNEPKLS